MEKEIITLLPHATSLIESMRSIGYSFETAIADIIDNSISAKATKINIFQRLNNNAPYVQIVDNGVGMNDKELIEAMRLGSKNPNEIRDKNDLGRFGLGLKSSSFSQCRILTVVSKKEGLIHGYQWNLDLVEETNSFNVKKLNKKDLDEFNNISELRDGSGTIVQWEAFDRISNSTHDLSHELAELMNEALEHISLIFHRFINEGLKISINFESVPCKDPFLVNHSGTQELKDKKVIIEGETIHLVPYVLPHYSRLKTEDKRTAGKANEQFKSQGFYLYRNKRLIVWGDYLGLARKSEFGKNVRIKVDIPNSLDYLWEIDVKKSRAKVPSKIKKNLLSTISDGEVVSKRVNTYKGKKELGQDKPVWQLFEARENEFHFEINPENELYLQFISTLNEDQKKLFKLFSKSLEANIPFQTIYSQISEGKENYKEDENLLSTFKETLLVLREMNLININNWLKSMLSEEPFSSNQNVVNFINKELSN